MFYKTIILSILGLLLFVLMFIIVILGVISLIELIVQAIIKMMHSLLFSQYGTMEVVYLRYILPISVMTFEHFNTKSIN